MDRVLWPVTTIYSLAIAASFIADVDADVDTICIIGAIFLVGAILRDLIIARTPATTSQET